MRRLALLGLVVGVSAVAGFATDRHHAAAAETHVDCITFDSNGNFVGVTPNCSMTISQRGGDSQSFPSANPCTGDSGTVTLSITHQVYHINVNGASDAWDTGTQNGTLTFTPDDPSKASGSGSWTDWFGDSFNAQNLVQHFTFHASIHTSTGQTVGLHEIGHVSFAATDPVTPVVAFDKPNLSCSH